MSINDKPLLNNFVNPHCQDPYNDRYVEQLYGIPRTRVRVPVEMHVFHISSIVLVPWSSCLGGYLSVPDYYPLVLGCEEHVSSLGIFVA